MDPSDGTVTPMIIFYYGNDGYRVAQAGQEIVDRYQAKYPSGLNLFRVDAGAADAVSRIQDVLRNDSFFQEVKLICVTQAFTKKETASELASLLERHNVASAKDIVLCVCASEEKPALAKNGKALLAYLEKHAQPIKEFAPLSSSQLVAWIRKECETHGITVAPDAARMIVDRIGDDTWALAQTIEKLANYARQGSIGASDVATLVPAPVDQNIFILVDAIATKNKALAIELLAREMGTGRDPHYILSMITFQFRNLLNIKDLQARKVPSAELARKSGLAPFIAKKTEVQARKFTQEELSGAFSRLAELDLTAKQGLAHLEDELMAFILRQA